MTNLNNKTLFVSGASRGIGLAIAKRAAQDGANIILAAKTADPHPKLPGTIYTAAEEIEQAGGKAFPVICDIRSEEQVDNAVSSGAEQFGGIDICINNASAIQLTGTLQTDMKRYDFPDLFEIFISGRRNPLLFFELDGKLPLGHAPSVNSFTISLASLNSIDSLSSENFISDASIHQIFS